MSNPRSPTRRPRRLPERNEPADPAIDALLARFERCSTPEERARLGMSLATAGERHPRVRAALVRMLEDDPLNASAYLCAFGDRSARVELAQALDRLLAAPIADCVICAAEHLTAVATAIRQLGGRLSDEQHREVDAAMDRAVNAWIPLQPHAASSPDPDGRGRAGLHDGPCPGERGTGGEPRRRDPLH